MATPRATMWKIEEHTVAKHGILRQYLDAWFGIIGNQFGRAVYLDGFCGPGRYPKGEPGSPIIALSSALAHQHRFPGGIDFYFVDTREDRLANLERELSANYSRRPEDFRIHIKKADFSDFVGSLISEWGRADHPTPVFAFVDPLGFSGIPFELMQQLLSLPHTEIFVNIMVDFVNRFLEHPHEAVSRHVRVAYGTDEVFRIAEGAGDRIAALIALYRARLLNDTLAEFVLNFNMINKLNHILYSLFFATKHPKGFEKMKDAMWDVDPQGEFAFRDPKDSDIGQLSLFLESAPAQNLSTIITKDLAGTVDIRVDMVWDYVNRRTIYQHKHFLGALRIAEADGLVSVRSTKADGTKRTRGFPDNALLTFRE